MRRYLLLLLLGVGPVWAGTPVDPHNLLPNGDFEEAGIPPAHWRPTAAAGVDYTLTDDALCGTQALKIACAQAGGASIQSDPAPVAGGTDYLLTFWYRADGMSTKGWQYDGCSAVTIVQWLDNAGNTLKNTKLGLPYGAEAVYRNATCVIPAPAGAAKALFRLDVGIGKEYRGPPTVVYLDGVRLAKLAPPVMPASPKRWTYLNRKDGNDLRIVPDPDAEGGVASFAEAGKVKDNVLLTWGQYTSDQPIGDYLAIFRVKVKDNTVAKPVAVLNINPHGALGNALNEGRMLLGTDFTQSGVYQEFPVRFIRPEDGVLSFIVSFMGNSDLWFDKTTIVQLGVFATDRDQAAIWLGE